MTRHLSPLVLLLLLFHCQSGFGAELDWIRISENGRSFVYEKSGEEFVPWGLNYDHDREGRLIEDYWHKQWTVIEGDFAEMKKLGANVVRIHLQFGKMMNSANEPNQQSLDRLEQIIRLAETTGLYLDVTGLGCYHKRDVPKWYDLMNEEERWTAQARFWEAVARRCAGSPAIFCYDLMNEPVVPGGSKKRDDWLGPAFAGKHFVQFIALETKERARHEIARQWIRRLTAAVRKHDRRHLITVGLVPWSLDRPGLTSGFVPDQIVDDVDFIAVHLYPERGKLTEALETLKGFSVGKPVVIEEIFPLKCTAKELGTFIDESQEIASGWVGFYWGRTPEEYRNGTTTLADTFALSWLELFQRKRGSVLRDNGPK